LNDDAKKKLKEKMSAVVSDEDLDNVAGGTQRENFDILNAMMAIDPNGVQAVLDYAAANAHNHPQIHLSVALGPLVQKHLGINVVADPKGNNYYFMGEESLSHEQVMNMIKKKIAK